MKHVAFAFLVVWLEALGSAILILDVMHGGQLHLVSGIVGGLLQFLAVSFAVPLRIKAALEAIGPYLPAILKAKP